MSRFYFCSNCFVCNSENKIFRNLSTFKSFLTEIADFCDFFGWNNFPLRFWTGPLRNLQFFFIFVWDWRKRNALNLVKSQPGRFSRFVAIFFLNRRHFFQFLILFYFLNCYDSSTDSFPNKDYTIWDFSICFPESQSGFWHFFYLPAKNLQKKIED